MKRYHNHLILPRNHADIEYIQRHMKGYHGDFDGIATLKNGGESETQKVWRHLSRRKQRKLLLGAIGHRGKPSLAAHNTASVAPRPDQTLRHHNRRNRGALKKVSVAIVPAPDSEEACELNLNKFHSKVVKACSVRYDKHFINRGVKSPTAYSGHCAGVMCGVASTLLGKTIPLTNAKDLPDVLPSFGFKNLGITVSKKGEYLNKDGTPYKPEPGDIAIINKKGSQFGHAAMREKDGWFSDAVQGERLWPYQAPEDPHACAFYRNDKINRMFVSRPDPAKDPQWMAKAVAPEVDSKNFLQSQSSSPGLTSFVDRQAVTNKGNGKISMLRLQTAPNTSGP